MTAKVAALTDASVDQRLRAAERAGLREAEVHESLQRYVTLACELAEAPTGAVAMEGEQPEAVAYLGSPVSAGGENVGVLYVTDSKPRTWDERTTRALDTLAAAVSAELDLRLREAERRAAAHTDTLTGLGNRRALARALDETLGEGRTAILALLDLDGFKAYNESFGHPAGDDLLVRLAHRLQEAVEGAGEAYRMGGDEFGILVDDKSAVAAARDALVEYGPGFCVTSCLGSIQLPREAADTTAAIGIAEARVSGEKRGRPSSVDYQLSAALSVALSERDGDLGGHSDHVSSLAREVANALGMDLEDVRHVALAGRLHDIGKMAISERILNKTGPLDDDEWALMKCHTMIGERILAAAPALSSAASLVRSSHERWDGRGYPDGLRGEEIPLGARIIFACDAYDAMRSKRPYREPLTQGRALQELRDCAGSQFDPDVIEVLLTVTVAKAV